MNNSYPYDQRGACSIRSLATLLIAWVSAAIIAAILLHWSYAYLALALLTIFFLIACGYASCTSSRHSQSIYADQEQQLPNIQTIARQLDPSYFRDPPQYQTYWITDLPPPYATPMAGRHATNVISADQLSSANPPPYEAVVQSNNDPTQFGRNDATRRSNSSQTISLTRTSDKKSEELPVLNPLNDSNSIIIDSSSNRREEIHNQPEEVNSDNSIMNR